MFKLHWWCNSLTRKAHLPLLRPNYITCTSQNSPLIQFLATLHFLMLFALTDWSPSPLAIIQACQNPARSKPVSEFSNFIFLGGSLCNCVYHWNRKVGTDSVGTTHSLDWKRTSGTLGKLEVAYRATPVKSAQNNDAILVKANLSASSPWMIVVLFVRLQTPWELRLYFKPLGIPWGT